MSSAKKLMGTTAVGGALAIEDVFSTYLYTGNATARSITNGIDLAGEGGLVWSKSRSSGVGVGDDYHFLFDTERGSDKYIFSNATNAEVTSSLLLTSFNSDGYSIGTRNANNKSGETYASWTWRKAPRFFDVVTWTGTGSGDKTLSHNLGVEPGMIIVRRTSEVDAWHVYHRSLGTGTFAGLELQSTNSLPNLLNYTLSASSTEFVVRSGEAAGKTYVAYLFAHDPLGPSGDGSDGLIACGSYTGNGSATGPEINLGWEPQWVLIKNASTAGNYWHIYDVMRGWVNGGNESTLLANTSDAENGLTGATNYSCPTSTGFRIESASGEVNTNGNTYIYIAIRRGPMRAPTSGTEVFSSISATSSSGTLRTVGFPMDLNISRPKSASSTWIWQDRMRGFGNTNASGQTKTLNSDDTDAESSNTTLPDVYEVWNTTRRDGGFSSGNSSIWYHLRRAPGFFDVVAYTGNGVAGRTVTHNLGVAPEMMIVKKRNNPGSWAVYHNGANSGVNPENYHFFLEQPSAQATDLNYYWYQTAPTATDFTLGISANVNQSTSNTYIAYLFASCLGVSKVGSYTGSSGSINIDCGFTNGARFVLVKRTNSTGSWYLWDSARGIVSANDPYLILNSTTAQITSNDFIDPLPAGFTLNTGSAAVNESGGEYIFLAIA